MQFGSGDDRTVRMTAHVSCDTGALTAVLRGGLLSMSSSLWLNDNLQ